MIIPPTQTVFLIGMRCVFFLVGTEFLNAVLFILNFVFEKSRYEKNFCVDVTEKYHEGRSGGGNSNPGLHVTPIARQCRF